MFSSNIHFTVKVTCARKEELYIFSVADESFNLIKFLILLYGHLPVTPFHRCPLVVGPCL